MKRTVIYDRGFMIGDRQLPLPFQRVDMFTDAGFVRAASNRDALAWLEGDTAWPVGRLALWGGTGCGKTHLLQVWAHRIGAEIAMLTDLANAPPQGPLALDDADLMPERALLHTLNAAAEAGMPVLLTSRRAPARWDTMLPDLTSRLRATNAVEIRPAEDSLLRAMLASQLAARQLRIDSTIQDWLLLRLPRTPGIIREAAARLDRASLLFAGRFTRARIADVLSELVVADATTAPDARLHQHVTRPDPLAGPHSRGLL